MLLRFNSGIITWILFASIAICFADYQQGSANYGYGEEILGNFIPYEKFTEGDQVEPLLYGQYTVTENVSPLIPINPYTESLLSGFNYQTPAIGYSKSSMGSYKRNYGNYDSAPSYDKFYDSSLPNEYTSLNNPANYATNNYNSKGYSASSAYQPALPNYNTNYPPKSEVHYGLNYEMQNQKVFFPTIIYPSNSGYSNGNNYGPPAYQPMSHPSAYQPAAGYGQYKSLMPQISMPSFKKIEGGNASLNETKTTSGKEDDKAKSLSKEETKTDKPNDKSIPVGNQTPSLGKQTRSNSTRIVEKKLLGYTYIRRKTLDPDLNRRRSTQIQQQFFRGYRQPIYRSIQLPSLGNLALGVPNQIPNQIPNQNPNQNPNQIPNQNPNQTLNQAPNQMPNQNQNPNPNSNPTPNQTPNQSQNPNLSQAPNQNQNPSPNSNPNSNQAPNQTPNQNPNQNIKPNQTPNQNPNLNQTPNQPLPVQPAITQSLNLGLDNKTTTDNNKRSNILNQIKYKALKEAPKYTKENNIFARDANPNYRNYGYNGPSAGLGYNGQSGGYNGQSGGGYSGYGGYSGAYFENNYGEAVLRGYSVNAQDNNNKAIVRIIEELYNGCLFEIRICNLKQDHLYAIYVHDFGQITSGCESTGNEYGAQYTFFNPMLGVRTNPIGFIGAFKYPGENLNIQHFTKDMHLQKIKGLGIVIHELTTNVQILSESITNNLLNNFSMLMNPLSSPLVTSKRVACGVIGVANPYSFLKSPNQNCDIEVPVEDNSSSSSRTMQSNTNSAMPTGGKRATNESENDKQKKTSDLKSENVQS